MDLLRQNWGNLNQKKEIFTQKSAPKLKIRFWRACARRHVEKLFQNISKTRTSALLKFKTSENKKNFA